MGIYRMIPDVYQDRRGTFVEAWRENESSCKIVQINTSQSAAYVLRGIHYQLERPTGKLIRVVQGSVYQVSVDLRRSSPTFKAWHGIHLNSRTQEAVYVPEGFGNAILAGPEGAVLVYGMTDYFWKPGDRAIRWDDPTLGINWGTKPGTLTLSAKDRAAPTFDEALAKGEVFE